MIAIGWLDTNPVYMIATGVSSQIEGVVSRQMDRTETFLTAFEPIVMYHKYMCGFDTNDYMRMGVYLLQKTYHMKY
jgi:hypothetical protein